MLTMSPDHGVLLVFGLHLAMLCSSVHRSVEAITIRQQTEESVCRCDKTESQADAGRPSFKVVWNTPTGECATRFGVPIQLRQFGIVANKGQTWNGDAVVVFYGGQLGLYPYYSTDGKQVFNNGLPQLVNLTQHLQKSAKDIEASMPEQNYSGLAVIDWEPWRPLWDRNWDSKKIYQTKSIDMVKASHPEWPATKIEAEAKTQFEAAGRAMFEATVRLGRRLRPHAHWGFYGFPDCYGKAEHHQCNVTVEADNDRLLWLFNASSALFPSIYLQKRDADNMAFVRGRLCETLRLGDRVFTLSKRRLPIFPYFRSIYASHPADYDFLDEPDMFNTVGLAARLGSSGLVVWGDHYDERTSAQVCTKINSFVATTLGPITEHARKKITWCSVINCHGNGRCLNKEFLTDELRIKYEQPRAHPHCDYERA